MAKEVKVTVQQLPHNLWPNDCPYKVPKEKKLVKRVRVEVPYHRSVSTIVKEVKCSRQQLPHNLSSSDCSHKVPKEKKRVKMVRVEATYHWSVSTIVKEVKVTVPQLPHNLLPNDCLYKVPKEKKREKIVRVEVTYRTNSSMESANTKNELSKPFMAESPNKCRLLNGFHICRLLSVCYSLEHGRHQESFSRLFLHTSILHKLTRLMFWVKIAEYSERHRKHLLSGSYTDFITSSKNSTETPEELMDLDVFDFAPFAVLGVHLLFSSRLLRRPSLYQLHHITHKLARLLFRVKITELF